MTGYMAEMRKLVGHRTIVQCGASIICVDECNRILLGKRSDNQKLCYAGGAVEIDEYAEECAKRELYEEMGLIAEKLEFFCVNSGPDTHFIYPNGDEVSSVGIVYICRNWHGVPEPRDGEMSDLRFVSCNEINIDEISPPIRNVIVKFIEENGK